MTQQTNKQTQQHFIIAAAMPACQQQQAQAPARIYDNAERVIDEAHIGGDFGAYCRGLIDTMRGQLTDAARRLRQHDNKGARAACDNAAAAYKRLPAGSSDPYKLATHICRAQKHIAASEMGAAIGAIEDSDFANAAIGSSPGALKALDMLCDYGIAAFANNALQTQRRRIAAGIGGAMDWQDNEPPYVPTPDPLAVWDQRAADYWRQRWQQKDKQAGHITTPALALLVIVAGVLLVLIGADMFAAIMPALACALPACKETKAACPPATGAATGGGYIVAWRDPAIGLWCFAAKYFGDDVAPIFAEDNKPAEAFVFNTRLAAWQWAAEYFTKAPAQKRRVKVLPAACGARWQDKITRALDARYQQQGAPGIAEVKAAGGLLNYWQAKAAINSAPAMQQQQAQGNAPLPPRPRYFAVVRYGDLPGGGCERLAACKTAGGYNTSAAAREVLSINKRLCADAPASFNAWRGFVIRGGDFTNAAQAATRRGLRVYTPQEIAEREAAAAKRNAPYMRLVELYGIDEAGKITAGQRAFARRKIAAQKAAATRKAKAAAMPACQQQQAQAPATQRRIAAYKHGGGGYYCPQAAAAFYSRALQAAFAIWQQGKAALLCARPVFVYMDGFYYGFAADADALADLGFTLCRRGDLREASFHASRRRHVAAAMDGNEPLYLSAAPATMPHCQQQQTQQATAGKPPLPRKRRKRPASAREFVIVAVCKTGDNAGLLGIYAQGAAATMDGRLATHKDEAAGVFYFCLRRGGAFGGQDWRRHFARLYETRKEAQAALACFGDNAARLRVMTALDAGRKIRQQKPAGNMPRFWIKKDNAPPAAMAPAMRGGYIQDGGRVMTETGNAPPFTDYYFAETKHGFVRMRRYCDRWQVALTINSYILPTRFAARLALAIYNAARRALPANANAAAINDYLATHGERLRLECKRALQTAIEAEAAK